MRSNPRELRSQREEKILQAKKMITAAEAAQRDFTTTELAQYNTLLHQAEDLLDEAHLIERRVDELNGSVLPLPGGGPMPGRGRGLGIPGMGVEEVRGLAAYFRTGDRDALSEARASNNTIMNVTTGADGLYAVPTSLHEAIIARRDEGMLARKLGVRQIGPGVGLTMNVVLDAEDDLDMVQTAEQDDAHAQVYDRDAPAIGTKAFTYIKYTKKVELTEEVLEDNDVNLLEHVIEYTGRAQAARHNYGLLTEVAANGTSLKTFAAAAAIAAGEPEAIAYNATLAPYLEDQRSIGWVMQSPTYGAILSITGNARQYGEVAAAKQSLLTYPVHFSAKAGAIGASAKSVYFGDWYSVGLRESPRMGFIRDDISVDGLVILKFRIRFAYGVVATEGVGYAVHPSA